MSHYTCAARLTQLGYLCFPTALLELSVLGVYDRRQNATHETCFRETLNLGQHSTEAGLALLRHIGSGCLLLPSVAPRRGTTLKEDGVGVIIRP